VDLGPRVRGLLHQVVSEHKKSSFLSIVEKRGNFSTMLLRRRDRPMPMPDPIVERQMCELHARLDAMRQHRGAQSTMGISVRPTVKMKLDTKEKKSQFRMLQMNAYSGMLQG
jgi:hypothetical protein